MFVIYARFDGREDCRSLTVMKTLYKPICLHFCQFLLWKASLFILHINTSFFPWLLWNQYWYSVWWLLIKSWYNTRVTRNDNKVNSQVISLLGQQHKKIVCMGDNAVLTDLITCQGDVSRKKIQTRRQWHKTIHTFWLFFLILLIIYAKGSQM